MHHVTQFHQLLLKLATDLLEPCLHVPDLGPKSLPLRLFTGNLILRGLPVAFELGAQVDEIALEALLNFGLLELVPLQVKVPLVLAIQVLLALLQLTLQVALLFPDLFDLQACLPEDSLDLPNATLTRATVLTLQARPLLPGFLLYPVLR